MRVTLETKAATRERILDVAKKQFASQGFDATTTRDIAQAAAVAVGTLFNYFPTKESIVESLVEEAWSKATAQFAGQFAAAMSSSPSEPLTLEEELFAHVAAVLRKLKPYRKYLPAVLETTLSPLAPVGSQADQRSLRAMHLETVVEIAARHSQHGVMTAIALQLYWTLLIGALAFWAQDRSPRQEDTLALLDESLAMYALWLTAQPAPDSANNSSSNSPSEG